MKTVRKCFLAVLSTVLVAVAASGVQAQSLPSGQGLNLQYDARISQPGAPVVPGAAVVRDANSRSSAFAPGGNLPFNPIRQRPRVTPGDGLPPVVRAPQSGPPAESFAAPQNIQNVGLSQLPEITPAVGAAPAQTGLRVQQQIPLPAAQLASNGPPLAYIPGGAIPTYVVPPGAPTRPQGGFGHPSAVPPGYGQVPFQMQQATFSQPAMGYSQGPAMGYPQGPPQPNNWTMPASYGTPQTFPPGVGGTAGPAGKSGGQSFCGSCGGNGCANCGYGHGFGAGGGFMAGLLDRLLPYSEGGQCAPRWYDITLDAMYLKRDDVSRRVDFTADGPGPAPNIIMSTEDLNFDEQPGVRLNAAVQVLATATAEFTYYGLFSWSSSDSRSDPLGGLFSPITNYATFPPGGFPQTDNAIFHSIAYSSSMDNFELNFRRRYTAPNCRVQASVLAGVRYFYLLEDFRYFTEGNDTDPITPGNQAGTMDYNIRARNSLTGFQVGADLWSAVVPGIKVGGEIKAGVFGNYGNQTTVIDVTEPSATFNENVDMNDIAAVADANLMVIWRVNPNWTVRAGYFGLYLEGIALAPEQFNSSAPPNLVFSSLRTSAANDNGTAFYHGGFAGIEWMW